MESFSAVLLHPQSVALPIHQVMDKPYPRTIKPADVVNLMNPNGTHQYQSQMLIIFLYRSLYSKLANAKFKEIQHGEKQDDLLWSKKLVISFPTLVFQLKAMHEQAVYFMQWCYLHITMSA